jgi:hypothetical protein
MTGNARTEPGASKFQKYVKDRERKIKRSLSAIEKRGVEGAVDRCRMLADQINRDLRDKEFGRTVNNISSLAEFQVSIERAAFLLNGMAASPRSDRVKKKPLTAVKSPEAA